MALLYGWASRACADSHTELAEAMAQSRHTADQELEAAGGQHWCIDDLGCCSHLGVPLYIYKYVYICAYMCMCIYT